jgi:hypothetical protein
MTVVKLEKDCGAFGGARSMTLGCCGHEQWKTGPCGKNHGSWWTVLAMRQRVCVGSDGKWKTKADDEMSAMPPGLSYSLPTSFNMRRRRRRLTKRRTVYGAEAVTMACYHGNTT